MNIESADVLIGWGGEQLKKAGIETPFKEARWLLAFVVRGRDFRSVPFNMIVPSEQDAARFKTLIARRSTREPFQHILGETGFMSVLLKTDSRALIPRQDSEEAIILAMLVLMDSGHTPSSVRPKQGGSLLVADLGTGSGALLASLLSDYPDAKGVAVELSTDAMSLAQENFDALGLSDRTYAFTGSWTDWAGWSECDLIISNPPYIRSEVIPTLEPEVRDHDPREALDGGEDGLDAYREIISLGAQHMKPGAHLVLEIGYDQRGAVTALLEAADFVGIRHQKDLGGQDRAVAATRPQKKGLGEIDSTR